MDRGSQLDEERTRRTTRRRRRRGDEEERRGEEEQATDIKSNNPHLAGGEKNSINGVLSLLHLITIWLILVSIRPSPSFGTFPRLGHDGKPWWHPWKMIELPRILWRAKSSKYFQLIEKSMGPLAYMTRTCHSSPLRNDRLCT